MERPIRQLRIQERRLSSLESGFTLIELIIVVSILGILAAIVLPEVQGHTQQAKESTAKDNLRILRTAIERYAFDHSSIPPGYVSGVFSSSSFTLKAQLLYCTDINGDTILQSTKSGAYIYGPYLNELPENPFNNQSDFQLIGDAVDMPASASGDYGWIYKPKTKEFRLDYQGSDTSGITYFTY